MGKKETNSDKSDRSDGTGPSAEAFRLEACTPTREWCGRVKSGKRGAGFRKAVTR